MKNICQKIVCLILTFIIIFSVNSSFAVTTEEQELKVQQQENEKKQRKIEAEKEGVTNEKESTQKEVDNLNSQIQDYQTEITNLDIQIANANQKIEVYQNIALCKNEEDIQNVIDEIIDRFGNMPKELENLIDIARIKYLSKEINIVKIMNKNQAVVFTFEQNRFKLDVNKLIQNYGNKIKFSAGVKPMITLEVKTSNEREILKTITEFLKSCH